MSDELNMIPGANLVPFPGVFAPQAQSAEPVRKEPPTPIYDELVAEARKLDKLSKYRCDFDYSAYKSLELRFKERPMRGGFIKSAPMKLVNSHATCQQCLYAFEIDSYGRGCIHNCVYCYAKAELTVHGYWNNPIPVPIDINELRRLFYTIFETDRPSKWREVMSRKIPLRVGCMSDSFMWSDQKFRVTQEMLKIFNFYRYPYTIITRSDLAAHEDYLKLIDPRIGTVQFSISSTNDELNRKIEPGAPSSKRRLKALATISEAGILTAVRINPLFPIYPDGYFTNPSFKWDGEVPKFPFSSFEMVDEIADAKVSGIIVGFGRFSSFALNNINKATGFDLRPFFDRVAIRKSSRDYHYSDAEIRYYYEEYKRRANLRKMDFTVCYIGNGENHFWDHQDLWSNKEDCCNIKGKVDAFKTDTREVPFKTRLKFTTHKCAKPLDPKRLHVELHGSGSPPEINL